MDTKILVLPHDIGKALLRLEAEIKMFSIASWFAIRIRPELTLDFVISHTRDAISMGVLFAGLLDCC